MVKDYVGGLPSIQILLRGLTRERWRLRRSLNQDLRNRHGITGYVILSAARNKNARLLNKAGQYTAILAKMIFLIQPMRN